MKKIETGRRRDTRTARIYTYKARTKTIYMPSPCTLGPQWHAEKSVGYYEAVALLIFLRDGETRSHTCRATLLRRLGGMLVSGCRYGALARVRMDSISRVEFVSRPCSEAFLLASASPQGVSTRPALPICPSLHIATPSGICDYSATLRARAEPRREELHRKFRTASPRSSA